MAPLPKRKHTRSRSNQRKNSSSNKVSIPSLSICSKCGKPKLPHKACLYCGFYK